MKPRHPVIAVLLLSLLFAVIPERTSLAVQTITGTPTTALAAQCSGPSPGDFITSASVNNAFTSIENDLATIKGGAYTTTANVTASGAWTWTNAGSATFNGPTTFQASVGEVTSLFGRVVPRTARVTLSDADHSIAVVGGTGVTGGKRFSLANAGAARTLTLKNSPPYVASEGETIELVWAQHGAAGPPDLWKVVDEAAPSVIIATLRASNAINDTFAWAEFEYVSGVWRLGGNSGQQYDVSTGAQWGVFSGPGA